MGAGDGSTADFYLRPCYSLLDHLAAWRNAMTARVTCTRCGLGGVGEGVGVVGLVELIEPIELQE